MSTTSVHILFLTACLPATHMWCLYVKRIMMGVRLGPQSTKQPHPRSFCHRLVHITFLARRRSAAVEDIESDCEADRRCSDWLITSTLRDQGLVGVDKDSWSHIESITQVLTQQSNHIHSKMQRINFGVLYACQMESSHFIGHHCTMAQRHRRLSSELSLKHKNNCYENDLPWNGSITADGHH